MRDCSQKCVLLLLMRLSSCFRGITLVQLRLRASDTMMNYSSEFMYHRRDCFLATVSWQIHGFCFARHQGLSYKQCVPPGVPNCHPCPIKPHLRPIKHKKQSHKTYNTNTNLKQNHKIHNTNTKLYNTNTKLKHNHKIRKTNTNLYNTNTNLKQNLKICNTSTKIYNTNTSLKQNLKTRKFLFVLWRFVLVLRILWFCFKFVFVL